MEYCLLICMFVTMTTCVTAMHMTQSYREQDEQKLHTVGVDVNTGDIIVGASRNLVKLSESLVPKEKFHMHSKGSTAESHLIKAVLVDSSNEKVILCKSGSGSCDIHNLKNLSQIHYTHHKALVPKDSLSKTLLFFSYQSKDQINVVNDFFGMENTDSVYTISGRNMANLDLIHIDERGSTSLSVRKNVPINFKVQYIYGFSQDKFIYVIANQPEVLNTNSSVVSKIARLCTEDKYYRSYVEIQLDCVDNLATQFPRALAAHYDPDSRKIYISFSQSETSESALCMFDLTEIDNRMEQTVKSCYHGDGVIGPAFFHKRRSCVPTVSTIIAPGQPLS